MTRSTRKEPPISARPLLDHLDEILPVVRQPRLGLVVDFDGTISEIVPVPADATITPRAAEELRNLTSKLALVSVVSGRSVSDLRDKVGLDRVVYVGNHGAEYITDGRLEVAPGAEEPSAKVKAVFDHLRATVAVPGLVWDDKVFSASVHYRQAPDTSQARRALTAALESAPGVEELEVFWGKLVLEMRPPNGLNKGYAINELTRRFNLDGAIFLGDDTTDLDALRALKELSAQGDLQGLGVAVVHSDSPVPLIEAADYTLDGVSGVESFLKWLESLVR